MELGTVMHRAKGERKTPNQERLQATKYDWVPVNKILVAKSDDELDYRVVSEIAESIKVHGLLEPIAVRCVTEEDEDGGGQAKHRSRFRGTSA